METIENGAILADVEAADGDNTADDAGTDETAGFADESGAKDVEIARLTDENGGKDAEIARLTDENGAKDAEIARLTDENGAKDAEITRLTTEIARLELKCGERSEFTALFPEANANALPDEVFEAQSKGVPLAAAYALWLVRQKAAESEAEAAARLNAGRSPGTPPPGGEPALYSAEQIKRMSAGEVRRNYARVMASLNPAFERKD